MQEEISEVVTEEVFEKLYSLQRRCINCNGTFNLQVHHRIFKSEGDAFLQNFLKRAGKIYLHFYNRQLPNWHLNDMQNLCMLCQECHEGNKVGVHGGNEILRQNLKYSFTCPYTGFCIPYKKSSITKKRLT